MSGLLPGDYTLSPNLGFYLPTYNLDDDLWGDQVNANMMLLDSLLPSFDPTGGFLPLSGGIMNGPLTLAGDPVADGQAATKIYVDTHALPAAGGVISGSVGLAVTIPTVPAPFVPTLFTQAATSGEFDLNAYRTSGTAYAYRAAGAAGRIRIDPTSGAVVISAAPVGAAGAAVTFGTQLRLDALGNVMLGGVQAIPADCARAALSAAHMVLPIQCAFAWNAYLGGAGPNWRAIAAGYGSLVYQDTAGVLNFLVFNTVAAGVQFTATGSMALQPNGALIVQGLTVQGRAVAAMASNASWVAYNTAAGYAAGLWVPAAGQLALGQANGAGVPVAPWLNVQAQELWWCSAGIGIFGALTVPGSFLLQFSPGYAWVFDTATGNLTWEIGSSGMWQFRVSDRLSFNGLGAVGGVGAYVNLSDARSKDRIYPIPYGLPEIRRLRPKIFHRIAAPDGDLELGFIGQDVAAVIPNAARAVGFGVPDAGLDSAAPALAVLDTAILATVVAAVQTIDRRLTQLEDARDARSE